ncbi:GbsR/MarR family transcriptional regulator [Autumnicola edwardsiae]|jgi:DNA-binding transcriptional regulator GbsR (MarR family)|uniref:Transcriptional regulator n=1 Tax=Autumnicola edwardsiae TaxID=3075594 RepID=A0ABU3CSV4_9FLAO|nr:transcriptional regulator [Zunongwangia sp. F297]MDT0649440.1 transcriptional regulator [Zunongwangia sp. F297]
MSCSPEKRKLVEEIGLHFEKTHQLAPLAARIYAIMILSPKEGHTFDEIMSITEASKSSVSTQLNLLLQLKKVEYFTKSGDRKRYFRGNKMYLKNTLESYLVNISEEIKIVEKITTFNASYNPEKYEKIGKVPMIFKEYLLRQEENLKSTITKISEIQNK